MIRGRVQTTFQLKDAGVDLGGQWPHERKLLNVAEATEFEFTSFPKRGSKR